MTLGTHRGLIEDIDRRMATAVGTDAKLALLSEEVARLKLMKAERAARPLGPPMYRPFARAAAR